MVHKDGKAAAHEHEEEKHIEEMAPAHPGGKPVRTARQAFLRGWRWRDIRQSGDGTLNPRGTQGDEDQDYQDSQRAGRDPDVKPPVIGIMDSFVRGIKSGHELRSLTARLGNR